MIHRYSFTVNSHSCDYNSVARPSAVMTYLQEAANLQLQTYGPTYDDMKASGQIFVLSRIGVHIASPLRRYETLSAETWACPSRGYSFQRCHRILRGEEVICEATSIWALIGTEDRRPLRVEEYHPHFSVEEQSCAAVPQRFRIDRESLSPLGKYTVRYADTDLNEHMNNTAYADMLCGFLDLHGRYVTDFSINYYHEAPIGTGLTVYGQTDKDGNRLFRTLREDGETNVEAIFTTGAL